MHQIAIYLLRKRLDLKNASIELDQFVITMRAVQNVANLADTSQELNPQAFAFGENPRLRLIDEELPLIQLHHPARPLGGRLVRIARLTQCRECECVDPYQVAIERRTALRHQNRSLVLQQDP